MAKKKKDTSGGGAAAATLRLPNAELDVLSCIWRQGAAVNELGLASPPEFWTRVDALGERRYYAKVPMKGMP